MAIIKNDKIFFGGGTSPIKVGIEGEIDSKNIGTGDTAKGKLLAADGEGKTEWVDATAGTEVIANPTLEGGEADLTSVEIDGTKYKVEKLYRHTIRDTVIGSRCEIITSDPTPFTTKTLASFLYNLERRTYNQSLPLSFF